jgi:hypothetical protein
MGEERGPGLAVDRREQALDWNEVLVVASELMAGPSLWCAVCESRRRIPAAVGEQLRQQYLLNIVRNIRFGRELSEAVHALNVSGVVPLLFKGALELASRTPGELGGRVMVDLDLLVPVDQLPDARQALEGLGYRVLDGKPAGHPHELPLVRAGSAGPIELHVALGSPPIPAVLPTAEAWAQSTAISVGEGRARALSPSHQVLHCILHSAVQDCNHAVGGLPLRQLLVLSRLTETHGAAVDWGMIGRRMEEHGLARHLRDHLWLAHRFAGMDLRVGNVSAWSRLHEGRVLASFALGWPAHVQRNVRGAMHRDYLDSLYHHGNQPLRLGAARVRHGIRVVREQRTTMIDKAFVRKA